MAKPAQNKRKKSGRQPLKVDGGCRQIGLIFMLARPRRTARPSPCQALASPWKPQHERAHVVRNELPQ